MVHSTLRKLKLNLSNAISICERFGLSNREGACITSAVLDAVKQSISNDIDFVIDKNKIHRDRLKLHSKLNSDASIKFTNMKGIFFDGKKESTLVTNKNGFQKYNVKMKEEHITIIAEPHSE